MYTKYIKRHNVALLFILLCAVSASVLFNSCKDDEKKDSRILLLSYGPMPIARGAELRFIGKNLDLVTSVMLPGNIEITEFGTKTPELITITVPQNAVPGYLVLKTPQGDIQPMTAMAFSEPMSVETISPNPAKYGAQLTLTGDYLNLVGQVIFTDNIAVDSADFISQSRYELKLTVPAMAQTGRIALSNGADDPIIVYSEDTLKVTLPAISSFTPATVKAGSALTINGTNLDLVVKAVFGGDRTVDSSAFTTQTATRIIVNVPINTENRNPFKLIPASLVEVISDTLGLIIPTVTSVNPNPASPGVGTITVVGTNLDLVNSVVFGGNTQGTIQTGGTSTQIVVSVPADATDSIVTFSTASGTSVNSPASLTMAVQNITGITADDPNGAYTGTLVTVTGTDLDIIAQAFFEGDVEGEIQDGGTATSLKVKVPAGVQEGLRTIKLIATNGTEVTSSMKIEIKHRNPTITSMSPLAIKDALFVIEGTDLDVIVSTIFYNDKLATRYGLKSDTRLEVYVPAGVAKGPISFVNIDGDTYLGDTVKVPSVEPVLDPSLIITDVTNPDVPGNWGGNIEVASNPAYAVSGNYIHGTATALTGWSWIWGNNWYTFPSVDPENHVFKIDINITQPFGTTNVHFQMEFGGTRIDLGAFGMTSASQTTDGWKTVTYDLSGLGLPNPIPSGGEWGINFWYADGPVDISGLYMDNLRFQTE